MHETPEKSGERRGRGRPVTGQAKTHAERQRLYRKRLKERPKPEQLTELERKELEQLRELIEFYQNKVTRDEKLLDHQVAEIRALNERITDLMKQNACLESAIELRDNRIRTLETPRRRRKT